jgi:BirA family biotin operon repressor/biotin-[acetyl-CoA-carboxylase] ligase
VAQGIAGYADQISPNFEPPEVMLKWPNDLYISGRKLAGILVETTLGENGFAVAGIGVNANQTDFPPPLANRATSLRIQSAAFVDRNALAAALLASLDKSYSLIANDFERILEWASTVDFLRGRSVSANAGLVHYSGTAEGFDSDAALLIRTTGGELVRLTSGEVTDFSSHVG